MIHFLLQLLGMFIINLIIKHINKNDSIKFVIQVGDITNEGLYKEYELFHTRMKEINKPYLTVIGNHDYLSNGKEIYTQMFGELNYSFTYNKCKFIIHDDTFWESNSIPDYNWLTTELNNNNPITLFIAHLPPYCDQFTSDMHIKYRDLLCNKNIPLSINGHNHDYNLTNIYGNGVDCLVVPYVKFNQYCIITISDNNYSLKKINVND